MNTKELNIKLRTVSNSAYEGIVRNYNSSFGRRVFDRFVIIGHARTGSNYLLDGLMSSRSVTAYHEIFADHNRKIGKDFEKILSQLYRKESKNTRIVGFKLFYNHLTEEEWNKFLAHDEFRVIHLTRANRLRTIVSLDIAFKTDEWTRSSYRREKQTDEKRIILEPSRLIGRLEQIQSQESLARERFKERPTLDVVYEDMVRTPQSIFQAVGLFLDIADIDISKIKIMKQNPEKLEELIKNFDEVHALLKDSKFSDCLSD